MTRKRRLLWKIFSSYLFITLISLAAVSWYASQSVSKSLLKQIEVDLYSRDLLFKSLILDHFTSLDEKGVDDLCKKQGALLSTRFTVILPRGQVVGDSDHDPSAMNNHSDRPEIQEALRSGRGTSTRYSPTLHKNWGSHEPDGCATS